ncbi:MAG: sensor histidine kinase [Anaerolineales bacterium]
MIQPLAIVLMVWRTLIAAHPTLQDPAQRRDAELLASLLLVMLSLGGYIFIAFQMAMGIPLANGDPVSWFQAAMLGCFAGLYALTRTRHYRHAVPLMLVILMVGVFVVAWPREDGVYHGFLVYYVLPVIVTQLFYGPRMTVLVAGMCSAAFFLFAATAPGIALSDLELGYFWLVSGFILVTGYHQRQVSDLRRAELSASESRYRQLVEQSPDAILVISQTHVLYANSAAQAFISAQIGPAQLPQPLSAFVGEDLAAPLQQLVSEDFRAEMNHGQELTLSLRDKRELVAIYSSAPIEYGGEPARQIIARDVTELRHLESQKQAMALEQARLAMLQNFMNGLSHDLKTPLTIINTKIYLLERSATSEQQRRHLDTLRKHTERLGALLDTLLTMLRLDRAPSFEFRPSDLNAFVNAVAGNFNAVARAKNQHIYTDLAPGLPRAEMDVTEMHQAVGHILTNALQHTPPGGTITLRSRYTTDPAFLLLEIQDDGPGIKPEDLNNIFQHFYRADPARSVETGGVGLGLTISRKIVEMHGGRVEVRSTLGQGTTFGLYIPVATQDALATA